MFDLIDRLLSFISYLLEPDPDQDGTTDMITHDSRLTTLATFQAGELLGLAVKLLNLPTNAAHIPYSRRIILSNVVCNNIVRAPGRKGEARFLLDHEIGGCGLELHDRLAPISASLSTPI